MNRLTKRDGKGRAYFDDDGALIRGANGTFHQKKDMTAQFIHQRFVALDKAIDLLAAYEDTGLEPQEIERIHSEYGRGLTLRTSCSERLDIIKDISTDTLREMVRQCQGKVPNQPLALDELLEMDGEWVWIDQSDGSEDCSGWAKVELAAPWKPGGLKPHVLVISENGDRNYAGLLIECGDKIYRCRPKEART